MKTVYYAHCMAMYGSEVERQDIAQLEELGLSVVNPNTVEINDQCGSDMVKYCALAKSCDCLAFRALPDGRISAGVWKEINAVRDAGKLTFELTPLVADRGMSVYDTRRYVYEPDTDPHVSMEWLSITECEPAQCGIYKVRLVDDKQKSWECFAHWFRGWIFSDNDEERANTSVVTEFLTTNYKS